MGGERPELGGDGVGDLRASVADVREPESGRRVEVLVAFSIPEAAAVATREDELVPLHLAHRRERVPEVGRRRRAVPSGKANGFTSMWRGHRRHCAATIAMVVPSPLELTSQMFAAPCGMT